MAHQGRGHAAYSPKAELVRILGGATASVAVSFALMSAVPVTAHAAEAAGYEQTAYVQQDVALSNSETAPAGGTVVESGADASANAQKDTTASASPSATVSRPAVTPSSTAMEAVSDAPQSGDGSVGVQAKESASTAADVDAVAVGAEATDVPTDAAAADVTVSDTVPSEDDGQSDNINNEISANEPDSQTDTAGGSSSTETAEISTPTTEDQTSDEVEDDAPAPFSDVDADTPHQEDVLWLAEQGISTGYPDGTFRPYVDVARCDMAAFLYRLAGSPDFDTATATVDFVDVDADTPHYKEIMWLASRGIALGWDNGDHTFSFRPYASIARSDTAALLYRLAGSPSLDDALAIVFSDVDASVAHSKEVEWLAETGVSEGWTTQSGEQEFRPYTAIARCDMAAFLHRVSLQGLVDTSALHDEARPVVTADGAEGAVVLSWSAVPEAEGYSVAMLVNNRWYTYTWNEVGTTFTCTNLSGGVQHSFVVQALVDGAWTRFSTKDYVTCAALGESIVSIAPTTTVTYDENAICISWTQAPEDEKYSVAIGFPDGSWQTLAQDLDTTGYWYRGATPGATYEILVREYSNGVWSSEDNVVEATVPEENYCWLNSASFWNGGQVTEMPMNVHYSEGRYDCVITKIILHHNAGNLSIRGCWDTWQTREASAHYQVQSDGKIGQLVWDGDTAWHASNWEANKSSIGIEHADVSSSPYRLSQSAIESGAKLVAALCIRYALGVPTWGVNVFGHSDFGSTECPASLSVWGSQHSQYMARAVYWYQQYLNA